MTMTDDRYYCAYHERNHVVPSMVADCKARWTTTDWMDEPETVERPE